MAAVLTGALTIGGWLGLPLLPTSAPPAAAVEDPDSPLTVSIDALAPSALPRTGPLRISGTVTNRDEQTWTTINLYPFISAAPMTTAAELAAAAEVPAEQEVGARITDPGPYAVIEELAPGESTPFTIVLPRRRIPVGNDRGVHWFGVHALGQGPDGRDVLADGRARTFLPSMRARDSLETALVLPLREAVRHRPDGRVADARRWTQAMRAGGRLRDLLDFGAAAGSTPLTWLVDPAVPDAAAALANGNPPRSLDPTIAPGEPDRGEGDDGESEDPEATPAGEPTAEAIPQGQLDDLGPRRAAAADAATSWLDRLQDALDSAGTEVLALPFGDVDVAAAAAHDPEVYRTARDRTGVQLGEWGVSTSPAVAAPSGFLSEAALGLVETGALALLSDAAITPDSPALPETGETGEVEAEGAEDADPKPTVAQTGGARVVLNSAAAVTGGPGPDDPLAGVAVRQRILGEAAVRLLSADPQPLVVALPSGWVPGAPTEFFDGLDVGWLDLTTVGDIAEAPAETLAVQRVDYPDSEAILELGPEDFAAATDLAVAGATLQNVLTLNDRVGETVLKQSLDTVSYAARTDPIASRAAAYAARSWIGERLGAVTVDAPTAVILSSGSGRFAATVTNELDQPVTVHLAAEADRSMRLRLPRAGVDLAAGARTTVLVSASSDSVGISNVTLRVTDSAGTPLGSADDLPIRSNRVSNVIWVIIGTGVGLLLLAIVVRLLRRIRRGSA